ncbi:hypothetical protein DACRYDRAFT_108233 [Dacryopinax primogenitus]|uniref:Uncharacterized protein n=1 Tax=Dacryopinax primogenitus (strain DJM 731) TaxID=1858805 RepID=M5FWU2_DACPD|nr:uncharacterized protein DACRYDRAFT_108233 [Dacryopinax primogenitus]EJU00879.1 hypothetical protein DACRYDRAFT_108233 [Dacryopinax primogenitus]
MSAPDPGPAPEMHYQILEIDSTLIDWEGDEHDWPGWMPYVDKVFMLFDATSRRMVWVCAAIDLIRDLNLPCIVVMTKMDLPQALSTTMLDQRMWTWDISLIDSDPPYQHLSRPSYSYGHEEPEDKEEEKEEERAEDEKVEEQAVWEGEGREGEGREQAEEVEEYLPEVQEILDKAVAGEHPSAL